MLLLMGCYVLLLLVAVGGAVGGLYGHPRSYYYQNKSMGHHLRPRPPLQMMMRENSRPVVLIFSVVPRK